MADVDDATLEIPELDERKVRILRAIVTEYVANGEPVGSRRVVEAAGLDVSAATVRNEMAALEKLGYIEQPHTSAGRVPADLGYRYFVDELRQNPAVPEPRREVVGELLGNARDLEDLLARTTNVLSQLTRLVSLVIAPALDTSRLKLIELVTLTPQSALLLMVADTGRVDKRLVELPSPVSDRDVERVRSVLNEHVRGKRMSDVNAAVEDLTDEAPSELVGIIQAVVDATAEGIVEDPIRTVYVGGQASLAGERSFEREQLTRLLELLEERSTLARLLDEATTTADEPAVRIGDEVDLDGLSTASLVAQRYRLVTSGSLGVLGPTRMDYASVLSTVRAVADQLQQTLSDLSE
ncbi:MAG: heat-inducible transcriptional repressor HrcA [Nitriliruptorales bacterium]|nr:heat-inducible transcriptional repressor HrcA [Nitriliruptorales bacterium]